MRKDRERSPPTPTHLEAVLERTHGRGSSRKERRRTTMRLNSELTAINEAVAFSYQDMGLQAGKQRGVKKQWDNKDNEENFLGLYTEVAGHAPIRNVLLVTVHHLASRHQARSVGCASFLPFLRARKNIFTHTHTCVCIYMFFLFFE